MTGVLLVSRCCWIDLSSSEQSTPCKVSPNKITSGADVAQAANNSRVVAAVEINSFDDENPGCHELRSELSWLRMVTEGSNLSGWRSASVLSGRECLIGA